MFGIDFSEIVVIFGLALVVLGPEKLPKLAKTIGRWAGRARSMARQFQDQLESETESIKSGVADVRKDIDASVTELQSSVSDVHQQVSQVGQKLDEDLNSKKPDSEQHERGV